VTASAGAFLYYGRGEVPLALTSIVVLGNLVGSAIGTHLNRRVRGVQARKLFAVLLIAVSIQMLIRVWTFHG
jgi:uncharacterized membrane protein YfcA